MKEMVWIEMERETKQLLKRTQARVKNVVLKMEFFLPLSPIVDLKRNRKKSESEPFLLR